MDKKQARMIVESLPSLYPMMRDVEEEAIWEILAEDINVPANEDCISRQAAIMDAESWVAVDEYEKHLQKNAVEWLKEFPPAQQNLSEEYAKAVRNWLVNYQIKCAELKGRYTPYEVLGWIVSDWRKENGIW